MADTTETMTKTSTKLKGLVKNGSGYIDWSDINFDVRQNLRDDYGDLTELDSLQDGFIHAVIGFVRDDEFFPVDGFRRLSWIKNRIESGLDIPKIKVAIKQTTATDLGRLTLILNSATAKPLTLVEQGKGYIQLRDVCDLSMNEIAQIAHKSEAHIGSCIKLVENTSDEVLELIESGTISPSLVIKTTSEVGHEQAETLIKEAVEVAKEDGKNKVTQATVSKVRKAREPKTEADDIKPLPTAQLIEPMNKVQLDLFESVEVELEERETLTISLSNMIINDWKQLPTEDLRAIFEIVSR